MCLGVFFPGIPPSHAPVAPESIRSIVQGPRVPELPSKTESLAPGGRSRRSDALSVEVVPDEALLALMRGTSRAADMPSSAAPQTASPLSPAPPARADLFVGTLLASAPVGICMLDGELRYRVWNDYLESLLGVAAADVIGLRLDDAPGLAPIGALVEEMQKMPSGSQASTREAEYRYPLGDRPWLRVKSTPVFEPGGAFGGVFVLLERVDRERFAESSLAALRQALESVGEMVLEVDRHGHVLDANETALKSLGYERDEIKGLTLDAIDVGLARGGFEVVYDELRTRGGHHSESRFRTRHGAEFPVETVVQRVEQAGREFILLLSRDISARKQAEEALGESAERFRALFDESPVAALLLDSGFRTIGVNRSACDTLGYPAEDLVGKDLDDLVHDDDRPAYRRMRDELQRGLHGADTAERRLVHREGGLVWTKSSVRALSASNGHRHFLVVLENFTDRKIFEEQLQVALRDQQTLFETMSVGVAQTMSGKILLANREFAELFGYSDGEVIGMPLWDLCVDRDNRMPGEVSGMPVVRPYQTTRGEVVLFRRDGEPVWCLVQARPIQPEEPDLPALQEAIYTFQDITEIKRQREALSRSLLELNVVLDATSTAVLHLADERVVRFNSQTQLMFGQPGRDLTGAAFVELFVSEQEYRAAVAPLQALIANGRPASFEARMRGPSGTIWGLVSLRSDRSEDASTRHDRIDPRHHRPARAGRATADGAGAAAADLRHRARRPALRARQPAGARQQRDGGTARLRPGRPGEPDAAVHAPDGSPAAREPRASTTTRSTTAAPASSSCTCIGGGAIRSGWPCRAGR